MDLDIFTRAYIACALWSTLTLEDNYSAGDLAPEALASIVADCARFQTENAEALAAHDPERAGRDFWLTRNGHGGGFWDGDWPEPEASALTAASKAFGTCDLYVGDDGRIYL